MFYDFTQLAGWVCPAPRALVDGRPAVQGQRDAFLATPAAAQGGDAASVASRGLCHHPYYRYVTLEPLVRDVL